MAYIQDVQESVPALPEAGNLTSFVVLSQNENGRRLNFKIVGVDIPSGSTATFSGTKPDGVVYSTTGTISGNIVTVNEDIQMTAVAGSWDAKIRVLSGGNVIASAKVRITIDADPVAPGSIPSDSQLDGIVAECQAYAESARSDAYGSPLTASTAAGMIDKTRVYVYTGSETGYTTGHWYYWDGTAWTDGGTYNSSGIQTDTTLSVPGMAADAKAVGDELTDVKEELDDIGVEESTIAVSAPRTVAHTINSSGVIVSAAGNYSIYTASVTAGKTYLVTASAHWLSPLYAYYDSNMDLVQIGSTSASGSATTNINNEKTIAPTGAAFLVSASNLGIIDNPILEVTGYELPRLNEAISDVSELTNTVTIRNLFNSLKVISGHYFNGSGVLITDANSAYLDDYIPIDSAETYIANADGLQICTYASDKTFIERAYNQEDAETPMTFGNSVAFVRISRYGSAFPSGFIFATEKVYPLLSGSYTNSNYAGVATKTATTLTVTVGKLKVVINKYNDSTIRAYNLWRTNNGYIRKPNGTFTRLWYNSDSDGVVRIKDEGDFLGGYHGDETETAFRLFVDGVEYLETATFTDLEFDELVLYSESDVYHCNTSPTPDVVAFKRKKTITFNKDGYIVENYWTAQEPLILTRAYMGMLSVERYTDNTYTDYLLTGYHTNYDYAYVDADTATSAYSELTKALFHTIYGDVGIKMDEIKTPATFYGDVENYNSSYNNRLKAYMANIRSDAGVSISQGAVIKAKATTFAL